MSSLSDPDSAVAARCPSPTRLQAFAAGTIDSEEDFFALAEHLDQCAACSQALGPLAAADALTLALRRGPLSSLARRWTSAARACGIGGTGTSRH